MPHRYAVLWEPGEDKARPVGLAVEQDGFVLVEVRSDLALPTRYDQPFVVRGPDMTTVSYRPQDPQYFDHVLLDLSRSLIVSKEGSVSEATQGVVLRLLTLHVLEPNRREHRVVYCDLTRTWPVVKAYQQRYYLGASESERKPVAHRVKSRLGASALIAA